MISRAAQFGGSYTVTISASTTLMAEGLGRLWIVTPSTSGRNLRLPNARLCGKGGAIFCVVNNGADAFNLVDNGSNLLRVIAVGEAVSIFCEDNLTTVGVWAFHVGTANFIPDPPSPLLCYLFGGDSNSSTANSHKTREYDQQLEVWTDKTAVPVTWVYTSASVAVVGAKAYCAGGDQIGVQDNFHAEYDPDTWTTKTDVPTSPGIGFNNACGLQMGSSAFHFNGANGSGNAGNTQEYAPGANTWTARADRPSTREADGVGGGIASSVAYLCGGLGASSTNAVDSYASDTFTARTNRPAPLAFYIGVTAGTDGLMYVYGGGNNSSLPSQIFGNVTRYDPVGNAWTTLLNFPRGNRKQLSATSIQVNNHVFGGYQGSGQPTIKENTEHLIAADTYTNKPDIDFTFEDATNQARAVTR